VRWRCGRRPSCLQSPEHQQRPAPLPVRRLWPPWRVHHLCHRTGSRHAVQRVVTPPAGADGLARHAGVEAATAPREPSNAFPISAVYAALDFDDVLQIGVLEQEGLAVGACGALRATNPASGSFPPWPRRSSPHGSWMAWRASNDFLTSLWPPHPSLPMRSPFRLPRCGARKRCAWDFRRALAAAALLQPCCRAAEAQQKAVATVPSPIRKPETLKTVSTRCWPTSSAASLAAGEVRGGDRLTPPAVSAFPPR